MEHAYTQIIEAWPNILLAWTVLFFAAAAPGPTIMAIMGISMSRGRKAGFIFTAGCMSGGTTWAMIASFGLSIWLTSFAYSIVILKIIGGLYLLWLGYKSFKSALKQQVDMSNAPSISSKNLYLKGLGLHLTNPKSILGWAAVVTLSQGENSSILVLAFTLMGCLLITYTVHFSYALVFASKPAMKIYANARRWIEGTLSAVFFYAGYRLLSDEVRKNLP